MHDVRRSFEANATVAKMAAAYALDAIDVAQRNFGTALDGSEASVANVEQLLDTLQQSIPEQKPSKDVIWTFAKIFGSYVGEVFRKNYGGSWGFCADESGEKQYALEQNGTIIWPHTRAYKRLVDGPENNVWHYYQVLARRPHAHGDG